jgi:arsenate reductase
MAHAFARRERARRELDGIGLVTGGTRPAETLHPGVVEAMQERGIDIAGRTPRPVTVEELRDSDLVVTMGCFAADACPAGRGGESRD